MSSLWEYLPEMGVVKEDLGGTTVPYERIVPVDGGGTSIIWGWGENGENCVLYFGGEGCELEVLLGVGGREALRMFYDEVGELEKINMSVTTLLYLTGREDLMDVADRLMDDELDMLIGVYVSSGVVMMSRDYGGVGLISESGGRIDEAEVVSWPVDVFTDEECRVSIGIDGDNVKIFFGDWELDVSRRVSSGAVVDVKTPGAANDFLFGELISMPVAG